MQAFYKSCDVEEHRSTLLTEAQAIVDIAKEEEREFTEAETERLDAINNVELPKADAEFDRLQKIEKRVAERAGQKSENATSEGGFEPENTIKIPARARAHRKLKAFETERDAYVAGQLYLATIRGNQSAREWCNSHGLATNTMVEGQGPKGGFLVPEEMQRALVRLREERGVFERYARTLPMGSDSMFVPRDINDVTAYWPGEGAEITASDNTLGAAELVAKKLACLTKVSTELDEDAVVDIGDMITRSMAYAMADKIDEAGFNGDGTNTYGGVTGLKNALHANATQDAASGNTGALTLDLADFEATVGLYPQYPSASPAWFVHSAVYWASMARLMDAAGGNRVQDLGSGPVMQFLGYPVVFSQVLPSTTGESTSTILAYFGDLSLGATVGTRRSVQTMVSLDRYFENDLIGIKATQRVAINVHERGDTIRTRPIVALKTAAS